MVVPGNEADCVNLKQTRELKRTLYLGSGRSEYFEHISLVALEGSSLTLMGTLAYNPNTGKLELTNVASFIAGGAHEAIRYLKHEIAGLKGIRLVCGLVAASCIGLIGSYILLKRAIQRSNEEIKQRQ